MSLLLSLLVSLLVAVAPARASAGTEASSAALEVEAPRVLAISVDGLNPDALRTLGRAGAPAFWRLIDEGAYTLNARTPVERTATLANHTSMVTGRRVDADAGGHGVTWNDDRLNPGTVQEAAGHGVGSVFSVVARAGGSTAVFSTKEKLTLFERSWPRAVDRTMIAPGRDGALARTARRDLARRELTLLHLGVADGAGHRDGFMSPQYLEAVRRVDRILGRTVARLTTDPDLAGTVVALTADHGGLGGGHADPTRAANYTVPFVVWGPGVRRGDLYVRNSTVRDPGTRQVAYDAELPPVRNGDLANVALDLLGLPAVPGSLFDGEQSLRVQRR